MWRKISYIISNLIFAFILYKAFMESKGWYNVIAFIVWFSFICSIAIYLRKEIIEQYKKKGLPFGEYVELILGLIFSIVMVYKGWIILSIINLLHSLLQIGAKKYYVKSA